MTQQATERTPTPKSEDNSHETPARVTKISTLLQRHRRFLTFGGAFLVFMTFIFKEGLKEELKNLSDNLENAQRFYILRTEIGDLRETILDTANTKISYERLMENGLPTSDMNYPAKRKFVYKRVLDSQKTDRSQWLLLESMLELIRAVPDKYI